MSQDDPKMILRLIEEYLKFRLMYEDVYCLCRNVKRVMGMFPEELWILDRNIVQDVMDECRLSSTVRKQRLAARRRN